MRVNRLTVFNHLWAIAGFGEWARWTWTEPYWSSGLFVGSLALIVFPNSVLCLALLAGAQVVFSTFAAGDPWNHGLLIAFVNLAILASIARCTIERRRAPDPETLVDTFAPALRLSLIVLYLWTFFHKLNADFVDPAVSCAGVLLGWLNRSYRILPLDDWAVVASIWATLFVELMVPLLLCFRRTVYVGLAIGAAFHLFMSQYGGLHGFAAMLFGIYFLFLPREFTANLAARLSTLPPALRRFGLPVSAALLLAAGKILGHFGVNYTYRGLLFWDAWLLGVIAMFGRELARVRHVRPEHDLRPQWAPLWAFPLVIFLNGLSPYVGLKTETSWAMYSNLRTETRPNHFIVPASFKHFGFQDDLVEILDTTLPALEEYVGGEVRVTFFELRRICSSARRDFSVTYRRAGEKRTLEVVKGIASDPEVCRPHPWLAGKLLRFRPVDTGTHATCRH